MREDRLQNLHPLQRRKTAKTALDYYASVNAYCIVI